LLIGGDERLFLDFYSNDFKFILFKYTAFAENYLVFSKENPDKYRGFTNV